MRKEVSVYQSVRDPDSGLGTHGLGVDALAAALLLALKGGPVSKRINVNPGQYKVAGRERQGENLRQEKDKAALAKSREQPPKRGSNKKR